jgi:acyl carrier protein
MRNRNRKGDDMTDAPHHVVVNDEDQYPLRPMMPRASQLTEVLADMIADASDSEVSAQQALAADCSFAALGMTSLAEVRFIDAIEYEFGINIDPDSDLFFSGTILDLAEYLAERGAELNPPS